MHTHSIAEHEQDWQLKLCEKARSLIDFEGNCDFMNLEQIHFIHSL